MNLINKIRGLRIRENRYFIFDNPINPLRYGIRYLRNRIEGAYYKLQMNRVCPKNIPEKKYRVSVCAIFKNEAYYLKEWIEYHKLVGVEQFYLYNNFSTDDYEQVLAPYVESGLVTLIQWPVPQGQMSAYQDCVDRFACDTKWIAFIDLDEFIVPNTCDDIYSFLAPFEKNRPLVMAYWKNFGSGGKLDRDLNGLVTEDFVVSWAKHTNLGKLFYNTAYDYANDLPQNMYMHYRWARLGKIAFPPVNIFDKVCTRGINPASNKEFPLQINHYMLKSYREYFGIKKMRGDAVFANSNHDDEYFAFHDSFSQATDHHIFKYLIGLKRGMQS